MDVHRAALPVDADRVGPQRLLPGPTYRTPWDQHALLSAISQNTPTPWWQRHTPAALSRHMALCISVSVAAVLAGGAQGAAYRFLQDFIGEWNA